MLYGEGGWSDESVEPQVLQKFAPRGFKAYNLSIEETSICDWLRTIRWVRCRSIDFVLFIIFDILTWVKRRYSCGCDT